MGGVVTLRRAECAVLSLVLEGRWYDMIASGTKREEYRAATRYWAVRLANWDMCRGVPVVEFRRGYGRGAPRMARWVFGQSTRSGMRCYASLPAGSHPEWGEPAGEHFRICLGGAVEFEGGCA